MDTTIRGHAARGTGILRNELYIGRLVWNRQRYAKDPDTSRRLSRPNSVDQLVVEEVPDLRIIEQALWDSVAQRLQAVRETPGVVKLRNSRFWEKRRAQHLTTGLVICGVRGHTMAAAGQDHLACNHARRRSTCTNKQSVRRGMVEDLILAALKDHLMAPDAVAAFVAAFNEEVNRQRRLESENQRVAERELAVIRRRIDGLVEEVGQRHVQPQHHRQAGRAGGMAGHPAEDAAAACALAGAPAPEPGGALRRQVA